VSPAKLLSCWASLVCDEPNLNVAQSCHLFSNLGRSCALSSPEDLTEVSRSFVEQSWLGKTVEWAFGGKSHRAPPLQRAPLQRLKMWRKLPTKTLMLRVLLFLVKAAASLAGHASHSARQDEVGPLRGAAGEGRRMIRKRHPRAITALSIPRNAMHGSRQWGLNRYERNNTLPSLATSFEDMGNHSISRTKA